VLGRIAKVSFERSLGTILGGWLGFAAYLVTRSIAWLPIVSTLFAILVHMVGVKLKLDYSSKLTVLTFILGVPRAQPVMACQGCCEGLAPLFHPCIIG
jgi:uncharacterized membrane protein YgaE (UPF0421/DUF939 family)